MGPSVNAGAPAAAADEPRLLLQRSAQILQKYSIGVQRVPLDDMGCAPFNRNGDGVNGKHAHSVVRRIVKEQGLVTYRYRRGLALSINPKDPLEVSRFTNGYVRKQSNLLAAVADKGLIASFAKTHLWHGLWTLKSGGKTFDGTGEPMEIAGDHDDEELVQALQHGLFFEILRWEAWQDHPEDILAMMQADNFDHAQGLADTEMTLLLRYHQVGRNVLVPPGMDHFQAVRALVDKTIGTEWTESERSCIYNLSKVIGEEQLDAMRICYQQWVDPKKLRVDPDCMQKVSKLAPELVWSKAAIIIANMMAPANRQDRKGGYSVGNAVTGGDIQSLARARPADIMPIEIFARQVLSAYSNQSLPGVTVYDVIKGQSAFLARIGEVLGRTRDGAARDEALAHAEKKLRDLVGRSTTRSLRPPVSELLQKELASAPPLDALATTQASTGGRSSAKGVRPDLTPSLTITSSGDVVNDGVSLARQKGILVGARVALQAAVGARAAGDVGVVFAVGDKVTLAFETPSADGNKKKVEYTHEAFDLDVMALAPVTKKAKTEESPATTRAAVADDRPDGVKWAPVSNEVSSDVMLELFAVGLYQAYVTSTLRGDLLRVPTPCKNKISLDKDVKQRSLVLLPFSREVSRTPPSKKTATVVAAKMRLSTDATWTDLFLAMPPAPKASSDAIVPFWALQTSKDKTPTLIYDTVELSVPLSCGPTDSKRKWFKQAKCALLIKLPCLTNSTDLAERTVLTVPSDLPPPL